ncbi:MBL fold metallo-hydrolase [Nocardia sp. NPDC052566]|uniref:MBL fold metallo-hydrolase n=1 Tax=Nocardia sp. NPDC052566 TaxID=3364330 RepID=UPI0037C8CF1A
MVVPLVVQDLPPPADVSAFETSACAEKMILYTPTRFPEQSVFFDLGIVGTVKVHHLNCGTMVMGMVDHCLLIETADCLVLVDTGFGLNCVRDPARVLGWSRHVTRPRLAERDTAIRQVAALGYDPADVRHILLTHLDYDHAGGLADFPWATVHVREPEFHAASNPTLAERPRYRPQQWAHGPKWAMSSATGGENWFGFQAVRELPGLPAEFLVVPLVGHTRGHAGVAVDTGAGWLLHAGDAFLSDVEIRRNTMAVGVIGRVRGAMGSLPKTYVENVARLAELHRAHGAEMTIFASHDAAAFERLR